MTTAAGGICTAATDCATAKSCCAGWTKVASTGTVSTLKACIADTAAKGVAITVTPLDGTTAGQLSTDFSSTVPCTGSNPTLTCTGYVGVLCAGVAAGSNTLAVSAAVAATAVYMM